MSITTLEQVFLEIGHDPNPKPKVHSSEEVSSRPGTASSKAIKDEPIAETDSDGKKQQLLNQDLIMPSATTLTGEKRSMENL